MILEMYLQVPGSTAVQDEHETCVSHASVTGTVRTSWTFSFGRYLLIINRVERK